MFQTKLYYNTYNTQSLKLCVIPCHEIFHSKHTQKVIFGKYPNLHPYLILNQAPVDQ